MPVLNPEHLLDQADRLTVSPGAGAPRQADLRRAISSAYYAVFHAVITAAADDIVGRTHRESPRYTLLYRSIDHRFLRNLCEHVQKDKLPERYTGYVPRQGFGAELKDLAVAVVELQEKRHLADYDPQYRVRTSDAVLAIATARTALGKLVAANRASRKAFYSLLVFSPR